MKKIVSLGLIFVLVFSLCSCAEESIAQAESGNEADEVTVVMPDTEETEESTDAEPEITVSSEIKTAALENNGLYYANTNTKKFHLSTCHSAKLIKNENLYLTEDRNELISSGFAPCKNCNP